MYESTVLDTHKVHGGIRHLENFPPAAVSALVVHGGIRHLEKT